jgi:tRNA A37 threonylcarbamoyladenosine modification protein TsaB
MATGQASSLSCHSVRDRHRHDIPDTFHDECRQVYWARYDATGRRLDGPDIAEPAALVERLGDPPPTVVGAGVLTHGVALDGVAVVVEHDPYPRAAVLAVQTAERVRRGEPADVLEPLYLRRPDARPPGAPKKVTPR